MKDVEDVEDAEDVEDVDVRCPCQCPAAQGGQLCFGGVKAITDDYQLIQLICLKIYYLLGQWLHFKLFGITYLVGKIKFKLFFSGSIG